MIAYHFPPMRGGSGMLRTRAFTEYLPRFGWQPVVLSVSLNAYLDHSPQEATKVQAHRSFALDAARHLAIRGRYPSLLAQPDRWISWWLSAVPAGLRLIREHRPDVIWSTYPIATAHLIGLTLHRLTGLPWIADQRDPMLDTDYPPNLLRRRIHQWVERQVMHHSAAVICTTPGAVRDLKQRYPRQNRNLIHLIENGYDEASFIAAETTKPPMPPSGRPFRLLHSGVIYPAERDPTFLLAALARLLAEGAISPDSFRLVLRASGHDAYLKTLVDQHHGLKDIIEFAPALPYLEALTEIQHADGLLLLQAANCNSQIPAKLYEYLRARRPVLALTHLHGDTAAKLRRAGIYTMAPLDSTPSIAHALQRFLHLCHNNQAPIAPPALVASHSRVAGAQALTQLLDRIIHKELP